MPVTRKEKFALLRQCADLLDEITTKHIDTVDQDDLVAVWDTLEAIGSCGLTMVDFNGRQLKSRLGERPQSRGEQIDAKRTLLRSR